MGYFSFNENGYITKPSGETTYIVGINYVASYICTNFWEDWRPDVIKKDLKDIAKLGLDSVRIPMFWGYMEPEEGKYNDDFFVKFDCFLGWCKELDLYIMPWFLVGVATQIYDVPFRKGRPFLTGDMLTIAQNHLKYFISRYKDEEQILFWDIVDEPEFFSMLGDGAEQLPYNREDFNTWVKGMYDAIKSVDQNHLVTLGFCHIAFNDWGIHVRDMGEILDFMSVTCYPVTSDPCDRYRSNYFIPFNIKMKKYRGKPMFTCESPGFSDVGFSKDVIGRYFKISLYSNIVNGSAGAMPWVYNDFERSIWHEKPLNEALWEPRFGIVTTDGELKPSGMELRDFAAFVKKADITKYVLDDSEVAILVPEGYYKGLDKSFHKIYTSFLLAKGNGTDIDFVWDHEDFTPYKLIIITAIDGMTTQTWDYIRKYVEQGGNIYFMTDCVSSAYFNELFGVEALFAANDHGYNDIIFDKSWGGFTKGEQLSLVGEVHHRYLEVRPTKAEVLCTYDDGVPALLRNKYGDGTAFLATKPYEAGLLEIKYRKFINNQLFNLYDAIMTESNIKREIRCYDYRVETACLKAKTSGDMLAFCINHDVESFESRLYLTDEILSTFKTPQIINVHTDEPVTIHEDDNKKRYINFKVDGADTCVLQIFDR